MIRVAIFLAASAAIIRLSWRPLRDLSSHGFYRFFAFELLSALILLNAPVWFLDPLSVRQLASWFFGASSIGLAFEGFRLLRRIGNPTPTAARDTNLPFEKRPDQVDKGVTWSDCCRERRVVQGVTRHDRGPGWEMTLRARPSERPYCVTASEQLADQGAAEISGAASDEDVAYCHAEFQSS